MMKVHAEFSERGCKLGCDEWCKEVLAEYNTAVFVRDGGIIIACVVNLGRDSNTYGVEVGRYDTITNYGTINKKYLIGF